MQFTISPFNGKWIWLLSVVEKTNKIRVLAKSLKKYDTQEDCELDVAMLKVGINLKTPIVVLGVKNDNS